MVTPDKVIEKIIAIQTANLNDIGITIALELDEDSKGTEGNPPFTATFELPEYSDEQSSAGVPLNVEIETPTLIFSSQNGTSGKNVAECFKIAAKIIKLIPGVHTLKNVDDEDEAVLIYLRENPLDVLRKTPSQAIVKINFFYLMDLSNDI
jgi:hypothetical protein